jgi:hypothetical protein
MATEQQTSVADEDAFTVGKIVQVEARTWPGINKHGGIGRITQLHYGEDGKVTSVDVRYTVVGGRERHVPIEHVEAAPEFDVSTKNNNAGDSFQVTGGQQRNQLRDRSGLLGRCKRCGSLRADCGSCDWMEEERVAEEARNQPEQTVDANVEGTRRKIQARKRKRMTQISEEESLSSSSSDEEQDDAEDVRRRRYRSLKPYWARLMNDSASDSDGQSSEDSDLNDPMLARLAELTRKRRENKRRLAKKYAEATKKKQPKRRPRKTGLSSLESLKQLQVSSRVGTATTSPKRSATQPPDDIDESPSPIVLPAPEPQIEVEDVGDSEVSSEDGLPPPLPLSPTQEQQEETSAEDDSAEIQVDSPGMGTAPDTILDLEGIGFIQPEGQAAAEHLPSDIIDRTQSIPYKDLPSFFDKLLKELTNETIPDSNLALADFQCKTRDARNRNDNDALRQLQAKG